jgi:hypothetical protein
VVNDAQLLIRTWGQDLDWLKVCLQSVRKFWSSKFPPVIIATLQCEGHLPDEVEELGCSVFFEPQRPDHRRGQCWLVCHADKFTDPRPKPSSLSIQTVSSPTPVMPVPFAISPGDQRSCTSGTPPCWNPPTP